MMATSTRLIAVWVLVACLVLETCGTSFRTVTTPIRYNVAELYGIRSTVTLMRPALDLPREIKIRKRGRKGGVRTRTKKKFFFKLSYQQPSLVTYNL